MPARKKRKAPARGAGPRPLSERQRRFVEAFLGAAEGNATEAARLAGYAGNDVTLAAVGSENLRKPQIKAAIAERTENDARVAKRRELQEFWTSVMRGEATPKRKGKKASPPAYKDRIRASELLAKTRGMFVKKVEHSGPKGGPLMPPGVVLLDPRGLSTEELHRLRGHATGRQAEGLPGVDEPLDLDPAARG